MSENLIWILMLHYSGVTNCMQFLSEIPYRKKSNLFLKDFKIFQTGPFWLTLYTSLY